MDFTVPSDHVFFIESYLNIFFDKQKSIHVHLFQGGWSSLGVGPFMFMDSGSFRMDDQQENTLRLDNTLTVLYIVLYQFEKEQMSILEICWQ